MQNQHLDLVVNEISTFLNINQKIVKKNVEYEWNNPGKTVAEAWNKLKPSSQKEIENFYKVTTSYIYDLSVESIRPIRVEWRDSILLYLSQYEEKSTLLDFGGGVGTEAIFLSRAGFKTTYYDLAGFTSKFAQYRFDLYAPNVSRIEEREVLSTYDVIVCLEVLEHLVDPMKTMQFLYTKLNYGGLLFLTESFEMVSSDYPSHLPENKKYSSNFENKLVKIGFSIIDRICGGRILVLGKYGTVDIIIPTYNAYNYVVDCVNSVKHNTKDVPYRFVFVNDASTDNKIKQFFLKERRKQDIYIENDTNLGFVKTANKGLSVSQNNDVVLLNTDTIVSSGWLSSLQKSIYKKTSFATANPLTNNASIYSINDLSLLSDQLSINEVGKIIKASSLGLSPEIPVSVGFCMYIKRVVLEKIGLLDEVFERGYGEESDFCMRCREDGYAHILVDDAFVFHKGHVSMLLTGDINEDSSTIDTHEKILIDRYPNYTQIVDDFIQSNVMERISGNVLQNITSLISATRKKILYVIHETIDGQKIGGTEFHVRDLTRGLNSTYAIYVTYILNGRHLVVEEYVNGLKSSYMFDIPFTLRKFTLINSYLFKVYSEVIKVFSIDIVHVQHLINQTLDIIYAAKSLGVPVIMTVHDYYLISPDYNLLHRLTPNGYSDNRRPTKKYFEDRFGLIDFDYNQWQQLVTRYLSAVQLFIFPSEATKNELVKTYPVIEGKWKILEHGINTYPIKNLTNIYQPATKNHFSVLFLGYVNDVGKGAYHLEKVIDELLLNNIEVHILGSASQYWERYTNKSLFFCHGNYIREDVVTILKTINPNLIVLASPWPETFSYTYSEALQAQIPVIAFDIGAFTERAKRYGATILVKEVTAAALINKILELSKKDKEYLLVKKQAKSIKLKNLEDNIEEYNYLYTNILKGLEKSDRLSEESISAIKKASFTLYETVTDSWQKQNLSVIYQQQTQEKLLELEVDNQKLKHFHEIVKTSLYYKIYIKIRSYRLYKLAKYLKNLIKKK